VNESAESGEPTLADVQREFYGWECRKEVSGLYYARRPGRPGRHKVDVQGEDPRDLRDQIVRWCGLNEEEDTSTR
jgi:hypothetical protein